MTGRPSTYTEEMGEKFCERLAAGESLRSICSDPEMPSAPTIYTWIDRFPPFAERYARARSAQTEAMLEEMLEIADSTKIDPQDKRVRIDTRKWAMSKLRPKKYGEKLDLEHSGPDGGAIKVENTMDLAIAAVRELKALRLARGKAAASLPEPSSEGDGNDLI